MNHFMKTHDPCIHKMKDEVYHFFLTAALGAYILVCDAPQDITPTAPLKRTRNLEGPNTID